MKKTSFMKLTEVVIDLLAIVTFIAVGFADAVPENRIWLYGAAIIGSLLLQLALGYRSGLFYYYLNQPDEDEDHE